MTIEIAVLVYDGLTALDAVGPMRVLSALPDTTVKWVAAEPGPKCSDAGVALVADHALATVPRTDIVVVPGALDVRPAAADPRVLEWLAAVQRFPAHGLIPPSTEETPWPRLPRSHAWRRCSSTASPCWTCTGPCRPSAPAA